MKQWIKIKATKYSMNKHCKALMSIDKDISEGKVSINDDIVWKKFNAHFKKLLKDYSYLVYVAELPLSVEVIVKLNELMAMLNGKAQD